MEEGGVLVEHLNILKGILDQLKRVNVKIDEKDKLLFLVSLVDSYNNFVEKILYKKDTITLEQVEENFSVLCYKEK